METNKVKLVKNEPHILFEPNKGGYYLYRNSTRKLILMASIYLSIVYDTLCDHYNIPVNNRSLA